MHHVDRKPPAALLLVPLDSPAACSTPPSFFRPFCSSSPYSELGGAKAEVVQLSLQASMEVQVQLAHCLHIGVQIEQKEELPLTIA